jgi:hypothetical protein
MNHPLATPKIRGTRLWYFLALAIGLGTAATGHAADPPPSREFKPNVPTVWDEKALHKLELPLAGLGKPVKHVSAAYYYRVPTVAIDKGYPVYHPSKEPSGYVDWLKKQEPQIVFDAAKLKTEEDWIKAGELVFHAPDHGRGPAFEEIHDPAWYKIYKVGFYEKSGVVPSFIYVVREKGKVTIEGAGCARCHARVLPENGQLIVGAQGNFPNSSRLAQDLRDTLKARGEKAALDAAHRAVTSPAMPWLDPDPGLSHDRLPIQAFIAAIDAVPPGVVHRVGTGVLYPPKLPDLIGVKHRKYLDATGLVRHQSIGDLMRYASLIGNPVGGMERWAAFGNYPRPFGEPPDPKTRLRFSDEQLYALALYVYSLKPPPNPNPMDDLAKRGQEIFKRERCSRCHSGDQYGGSTLTPVDGFTVPENHPAGDDVYPKSVGTDVDLAMRTRKGTGFYRVPSLRGVWYRGPFEHNGSVATLEDWFDPRRLKDDYVPTGFRRAGEKTRAVKGHPFGLDLPADDRKALIAFLRTL